MHLIVILLATVSVLTFLSGAIVFFGSAKADRIKSAWYFLAAIFATVWMASISFFLVASPSSVDTIGWHVNWTFISAIFLDAAFLGYCAWQKHYGKVATFLFLTFGILISATILVKPELLYSAVILANTGNSVTMNIGPLYITYIAFFATIVPAIIAFYLQQFIKSHSRRKKDGDIITMLSFAASSTLVLIFNLVLPLFNNWSLIYIGPLALAVTILGVYYTVLRYKMLNLHSIWLRIFSYVVIIASVAILYMVIFSIIFAALFRGSSPSMEVIILNFIMILIFLTLMPVMSRITNRIRGFIKGQSDPKELG